MNRISLPSFLHRSFGHRLNKRTSLLTIALLLFPAAAVAQNLDTQWLYVDPPISDLRGLTDSTGSVHIYYRLYEKTGVRQSYNNDIYHYDASSGTSVLFLEDYFHDWEVVGSWREAIVDYAFFDNDPDKFIYIRNTSDMYCGFSVLNTVIRYDTTGIEYTGVIFDFTRILPAGDEHSLVYATVSEKTIKSFDGGITWFDRELYDISMVPDSFVLDFPVISICPYDSDLMFGYSIAWGKSEGPLLRSDDAGATYEMIAEDLYPWTFSYDADESHVYFLYGGLYVSADRGAADTWEMRRPPGGGTVLSIDRGNSGHLYLAEGETIYFSADHGNSFSILYEHHMPITGIYKGDGANPLYFITDYTLCVLSDGVVTTLVNIPVSVRPDQTLPESILLHQNYPNPFNPGTTIRFSLTEGTPVTLIIYDPAGRIVERLISNEYYGAGAYDVYWNAGSRSSGTYFLELRAGQQVQRRAMLYIK
jgi:hypothetical protein